MANKMTQREFFNEVVVLMEQAGRTDLADFARGRIDALDKKSATKKPTKTQVENESVKEVIANVLSDSKAPMTVTEILTSGKLAEGTSNQKVSALLRQMIDEGKVVKTTEKKVSRFAVA